MQMMIPLIKNESRSLKVGGRYLSCVLHLIPSTDRSDRSKTSKAPSFAAENAQPYDSLLYSPSPRYARKSPETIGRTTSHIMDKKRSRKSSEKIVIGTKTSSHGKEAFFDYAMEEHKLGSKKSLDDKDIREKAHELVESEYSVRGFTSTDGEIPSFDSEKSSSSISLVVTRQSSKKEVEPLNSSIDSPNTGKKEKIEGETAIRDGVLLKVANVSKTPTGRRRSVDVPSIAARFMNETFSSKKQNSPVESNQASPTPTIPSLTLPQSPPLSPVTSPHSNRKRTPRSLKNSHVTSRDNESISPRPSLTHSASNATPISLDRSSPFIASRKSPQKTPLSPSSTPSSN